MSKGYDTREEKIINLWTGFLHQQHPGSSYPSKQSSEIIITTWHTPENLTRLTTTTTTKTKRDDDVGDTIDEIHTHTKTQWIYDA